MKKLLPLVFAFAAICSISCKKEKQADTDDSDHGNTVGPVPASIAITRTDSHFSEGKLCLVEGETFQLDAVVTDNSGSANSGFQVVWSLMEGKDYIELDASNGTVSTKTLGGKTNANAKVKAAVKDHPDLYDVVTVAVQPLPTGLSLSFGKLGLNPGNELIMKLGKSEVISVGVIPEGAAGGIKADCTNPYDVSVVVDGNQVKLIPSAKRTSPVTVTISSSSNKAVSKSFKVYVFDYDKSDVKPGDYVFCDGSSFRVEDCGLRHNEGGYPIYQDAAGSRTISPVALPSPGGAWKFIGVIACTSLPSDDNFLNCSWLDQCKDGSKATGLYEYRTFRKSSLGGFSNAASSVHALVVRKDQTEEVEWQHNNEFVSDCKQKQSGSGLYQSQLQSRYAFSPEACTFLNEGWSSNKCQYSEHGFLPTLLLKFYTRHLNDHNFDFIPGKIIDAYTDAPELSANKGTTGWFLPGKWELKAIWNNYPAVNQSLLKSGAKTVNGYYWSPEEHDEYQAYCYRIEGGTFTRVLQYKDTRTHENGTAISRAVLYL